MDTRTGHLQADHEDCECTEQLDHDLYDCDCTGYPLPTASLPPGVSEPESWSEWA